MEDKFMLTEIIDNIERNTYLLNDSSIIKIVDPQVTSLRLRVERTSQLPNEFSLKQNFPNPFNPSTVIQFELPVEAIVTLKIYNSIGQEVVALFDHKLMMGGLQESVFQAANLPSGIYFYRLVAERASVKGDNISEDKYVNVKRMLLLK